MQMDWYLTFNESSIDRPDHGWRGLIRVAVQSAITNTSLKPHLVYDGTENDFTQEMRDIGVEVIHHRVSFYDKLVERENSTPGYIDICSGTFLRTEIPLIAGDADFVLYTDCDVMFTDEINVESIRPSIFASAPQSNRDDYVDDINTGVMIMNVKRMREDFPEFRKFIIDHLYDGWPGCDQENYRRFYRGGWDKLPLEMNWKPYWGYNQNAKIVHWHGPKPSLVNELRDNQDLVTNEDWIRLYKTDPAAYDRYTDEWYLQLSTTRATIIGFVDHADFSVIAGWALNQDDAKSPVEINIFIDGRSAGSVLCNIFREDLSRLYRTPVGGFSFAIPEWARTSASCSIHICDKQGNKVNLSCPSTVIYDRRIVII